MAHGLEDLHPETIRREIDRAGAATLLTRRTLVALRFFAVALLGQAAIMTVFYNPSEEMSTLVALTFALSLAAATVSCLARPIARVFRGWQCGRLEQALRQADPEDLASALLPMRAHPLHDTRLIVRALIHDLRPQGSEVMPCAPQLASGIEVAPVVRRRRRSRRQS